MFQSKSRKFKGAPSKLHSDFKAEEASLRERVESVELPSASATEKQVLRLSSRAPESHMETVLSCLEPYSFYCFDHPDFEDSEFSELVIFLIGLSRVL